MINKSQYYPTIQLSREQIKVRNQQIYSEHTWTNYQQIAENHNLCEFQVKQIIKKIFKKNLYEQVELLQGLDSPEVLQNF